MVDPGEKVSQTVRREFMEEAMDSTAVDKDQQRKMEEKVWSAMTINVIIKD